MALGIKDVLDNLKEFKQDIKEDFKSVSKSVNLVAVEVKGIKTEVGNLKEQVKDQSLDIRNLSESNVVLKNEMEYTKKSIKKKKSDSTIPSIIPRSPWARKIYFFLAVGTVGAIAVLGYWFISKLIQNSELVSKVLQ